MKDVAGWQVLHKLSPTTDLLWNDHTTLGASGGGSLHNPVPPTILSAELSSNFLDEDLKKGTY